MMMRPLNSLVHRVTSSDIDLHLSQEATMEDVLKLDPDAALIATGAKAIRPSIAGLQESYTGEEVLSGAVQPGKRVLIIGGGTIGLETAEYLVRDGHQVVIVELLEELARDMLPISKKLILKELMAAGVEILASTEVTRLEGRKAFVAHEGNERLLGVFDSVVISVGTRSVNSLEPLLKQKGIEVITIGDAAKPRQIYDAVKEGYEAARLL
jgi:NADPH-dependent 2,4-dienoyl-CoA reductase/sulfur reductase-like enzyme